ncbi:MAG: FHA domain-containing protein [Verrucomicrobiales bacterium]
MLQFQILSGSKAGEVINCNETPAIIGRGSSVHVLLPDAGVWDEHLEVKLEGLELKATVLGSALASINGNPFQTTLIRNGDQLTTGAASFRVYLQPAQQKKISLREAATWLIATAIVVIQIVTIFILLM